MIPGVTANRAGYSEADSWNVPDQIVLKQRHTGGDQSVRTRRKAEEVPIWAKRVIEDSQATIGGNKLRVIGDRTSGHTVRTETSGIRKFHSTGAIGVHEVDTRAISVYVEQNKFDVQLVEVDIGERLELPWSGTATAPSLSATDAAGFTGFLTDQPVP